MIIDHIGGVFFPEIIWFRVIGRIAFPIFAFFIAEGYYHTRNKGRYVISLVICMIVSWVPFVCLFDRRWYSANALGVFLIGILGMFLIDWWREPKSIAKHILASVSIVFYIVLAFILDIFVIMPEGLLGLMVVLSFYYFRKSRVVMCIISGMLLLLLAIMDFYVSGNWSQFFALFAILLIAFYNGKKGKLNLKYLFYIGYPAHLIIFLIIKVLI